MTMERRSSIQIVTSSLSSLTARVQKRDTSHLMEPSSSEILLCWALSRVGLNLRAIQVWYYYLTTFLHHRHVLFQPHKYLSVRPRCLDKQDRTQDPGHLTPARLGELCESDGIFVNKTQLISQPVRPHFHLVDSGSVAGVWGREEVVEIIKTSFGMFLHSRENSFPCSLYSLLMHIHPHILRRRKSLKIRPRDSTWCDARLWLARVHHYVSVYIQSIDVK